MINTFLNILFLAFVLFTFFMAAKFGKAYAISDPKYNRIGQVLNLILCGIFSLLLFGRTLDIKQDYTLIIILFSSGVVCILNLLAYIAWGGSFKSRNK